MKHQFVFVFIFMVWLTSVKAQPNVVFIAIDDLNDWIGVLHGHPQVKTPNIDRLAKRGILFANAHTQSPLCNPSRSSILTGLRPSTTGIYGLAPRYRDVSVTANVVTLPQAFANAGYHTLSTGKILHGAANATEKASEFKEWGPRGNFGPVPKEKIVKPPLDMVDHPLLDWGPFPSQDTLMSDYQVASWTVNRIYQLAQTKEDPFFLAVGFHRPHVPLLVPQKWFDLYPLEDIILPPAPAEDRYDVPDFAWYIHWFLPEPRLSWLEKHKEWRKKVRAYLAAISFVDAQVGRVIDAIDEAGISEETLIVLWSDHGYHLGEKDITGKNTLWERSTHVPLIFAGPGIPQQQINYEAVELLDMYPTLLDLAGLPKEQHLEGLSLKPLMDDPNLKRDRPAMTTHNPGNHSVRTERWRYIQYADGTEELYDLKKDPYEWANLINRSEYQSIRQKLQSYIPQNNAPLAPGSQHRTLEKKEGQWYWEGELIEFNKLIR